jgi:hypothetical protein
MKKQALWVVASLALVASGCGMEQVEGTEADQLMDQAYADESFRATVQWLQADKSIPVDLSQGVVEQRDGATRITFALPSQAVTSLAFEVRDDGSTRVYTNELVNQEEEAQGPSAQAACGWYKSSDRCTTGPFNSGSYCSGGTTLYSYKDHARDNFQYGRKVYYQQTWNSCSWMAQSTTCNTTCS